MCELFWHRGPEFIVSSQGLSYSLHRRHSCQPLLWTCISLTQAKVFCFFTGGSSILNSNQHAWQLKEEVMLCEIHMCDLKSDFWRDFLAYCTRPVCTFGNGMCQLLVRQFANLFADFKTTTKSHENYVFLDPFSNMAISPPPPPNNEKQQHYFILVNCMGWQVWEGDSWEIWGQVQSLARNCPHLGMGGGGGGGGGGRG